MPLETETVTLGDPSEKTNWVKLKIELNSLIIKFARKLSELWCFM